MAQIDSYLKIAKEQSASDLHLSAGNPCRLRVHGDLIPVKLPVLDPQKLHDMVFEILNTEEREKFLKNKNLDKSYRVPGLGAFRMNIFESNTGMGGVFRVIPEKIPSIEELRLPASVAGFVKHKKGIVLVTGPTGSGKSTTLAALIDAINSTKHYHILTVEDPIEFVHPSKLSLVNQRQIGTHALSFHDALKYALREDPNVILVGEMRDLETISLALTAAETGHLVFGTLHTRGAAAAVDRIIDSFPGNQQAMIRVMLSESLEGVVSQALVKRADGQGRVAAFDVLINNTAVANLIREGKTFQIPSVMQTSKHEGMITMDHSLLELVNNGLVDADHAAPLMEDPSSLPRRASKTVRSLQGGPQLRPAQSQQPKREIDPGEFEVSMVKNKTPQKTSVLDEGTSWQKVPEGEDESLVFEVPESTHSDIPTSGAPEEAKMPPPIPLNKKAK